MTSPASQASPASPDLWLPAHRVLAGLGVPLMTTGRPGGGRPTKTIELAPLPGRWATRPTEATGPDWPARVGEASGAWAVMGARSGPGSGVDCLDVDTQKDGSLEALHGLAGEVGGLPRPELVQSTPSGGAHLIWPALDVRKVIDLRPGVDYQAGTADGSGGRGGIWIAPTVGVSKGSGELVPYTWRTPGWAAEMLELSWSEDPERSRARLAEVVRSWEPSSRRRMHTATWAPPVGVPANGHANGRANGRGPGSDVARGGSGSRRPVDLLTDGRVAPAIAEVQNAMEGSRNDTLNRAAMTVFAVLYGHLGDGAPQQEVDDAIARAWDLLEGAAREVGLTGREIAATLRSAEGGGRRNPAPPKDPVTDLRPAPSADELLLSPGSLPGANGSAPETPKPGRRAVVRRASDRRVRKSSWAWKDRLPIGALSLLSGKPARGKSTLAEGELAARLSRGELDGDWKGRPRGVLIAATEDAWEQAIQAKLVAHGADLERVFELGIEVPDEGERAPSLPVDVDLLREVVREHDIGMVVLDPLVSRLAASLDANKGAEVRRALEPLARLAAEESIVVLGVIHPRKAGGDAMSSVAGSSAFTEVVRSVLTVIDDPREPGRRLLGVGKSSYGPVSDGSEYGAPLLGFTVEPATVPAETDDGQVVDTEVGKIAWQGEVEGSLAEAMDDSQSIDPEQAPVRGQIAVWLRSFLDEAGGQAPVPSVRAAFSAASEAGQVPGASWRTVRRASEALGCQAQEVGRDEKGRPAYVWVLPGVSAQGLELFSAEE